ncbi:MAG: flagellar hook-length control protein FliK, partial [Spirochaetaceae bacterium]|nr:flagellar hook-length control protein FliK [Spirochaetaceae bacterium]
ESQDPGGIPGPEQAAAQAAPDTPREARKEASPAPETGALLETAPELAGAALPEESLEAPEEVRDRVYRRPAAGESVSEAAESRLSAPGTGENTDQGAADRRGGNEAALVLNLASHAESRAASEAGSLNEPSGLSFRELLSRELRSGLGSDIVRQAAILLRDGGEGTIRLSLRPESLGNIKIRLELTENRITGLIVVENGEALKAFESELASLEQSFRDSGYEGASLEMALSGDGGQGAYRDDGEGPWFSERLAASSYDDAAFWEEDAPAYGAYEGRDSPQGISYLA